MQINTRRFGPLRVDADAVILFPSGLPGLEGCRRWTLMADQRNEAVAWLQSIDRPDLALALVSPTRFVPDYQACVGRRDLQSLGARTTAEVEVLAILGRTEQSLTVNLKAPLLIDPVRGIGRQVINRADWPLDYPLNSHAARRTVA
jgi:flagellar assembly factor FliW